jgi:hypothetical protein
MFLKTLENEFDKWFKKNFPTWKEGDTLYHAVYKEECEKFMQSLLRYHGDYKTFKGEE